MRSAEARLSASTMISSSIRFSLVGAQVDCTTNTSRARTFGVDLDGDFTVGEAAHAGCAERNAQVAGDLLRQGGIGVAGENHEIGMRNNLH